MWFGPYERLQTLCVLGGELQIAQQHAGARGIGNSTCPTSHIGIPVRILNNPYRHEQFEGHLFFVTLLGACGQQLSIGSIAQNGTCAVAGVTGDVTINCRAWIP